MTARTPQEPGDGDVSTTLSELERRLRRLEAELTATFPPHSAEPPRSASGMGDADRLLSEARARLGGLTGQVDELLRFREQLRRTARELEAEYSRLLERIGAPPCAPSAPPAATAPVPSAPEMTPPPAQPAVPGVSSRGSG